MEDSFRVRVDKVFGSLNSSSSNTTSSVSSLWCLTDEEIGRREWNREKDGPDDVERKTYPSNLDGFFANQRGMHSQNEHGDSRKELEANHQDLDDLVGEDEDNDNGEEKQRSRRHSANLDDHGVEEWDIRSSIGLDSTLDYEEEEDEYDKVAVGRENSSDRLYMRNITDYGVAVNYCEELPNTFNEVARDPRANHMAAKLRLKEDAEAAGNFDSLWGSYAGSYHVNTQSHMLEDGTNLKSILKRKENQTDGRSDKRVRFDPACLKEGIETSEGTEDTHLESFVVEETKVSEVTSDLSLEYFSSGIPDYVRNPSRYTHYTFDSSSDMDEESNKEAYLDFFNLLRKSRNMELQADDSSFDLPKSVTFASRKKHKDTLVIKHGNEFKQSQDVGKESCKKGWSMAIGIAVRGVQESESDVCEMEEDEPETVAVEGSNLKRQARQYRTRGSMGSDEVAS